MNVATRLYGAVAPPLLLVALVTGCAPHDAATPQTDAGMDDDADNDDDDDDDDDGLTDVDPPDDEGCIGVDPSARRSVPAGLWFNADHDDRTERRDPAIDTETGESSGDGEDDGEDDGDGEDDDCKDHPGTCIGEPWPQWSLLDVQPRSCGVGQTYGLDAFKGDVTFVALLAGW
ncbi:MAG: hypothetical protein V3V08_18115 [Nannocystaceae bacterium]